MTGTPLPILPPRYCVIWTLNKGYPIDSSGRVLNRNIQGVPILKDITDDSEPILSFFHTTYSWTSVDLSFSMTDELPVKPLIGYTISAKVYVYSTYTLPPDPQDPDSVPEKVETISPVSVTLDSLTIKSSDPNSGGTWIYPDDFDVTLDDNHPTQYGGVILFDEIGPTLKGFFDSSTCGIDDGPNNNGIIPWLSTQSIQQETISGYTYLDVFDRAEFEYIPRNVGSNSDEYLGVVEVGRGDNFRFTPLFDDIVDPEGRPAPIYPMDMITKFLPDDRDAVDVTYTATLKISDAEGNPIPLENGVVTINQTCTQNVDDYGKQLERLLQYCNYNNTLDINLSDYSPTYPYDYPYTLVNGFEGLGVGQTPSTRGEDMDFIPLKRGDVWYNPETKERFYYTISDGPDSMTIMNPGELYRTHEEVACVWKVPEGRCQDKKIKERARIPYGLLADIITVDGKITQVSISPSSLPSGFQDGDIVSVIGGDGSATLRINIDTPPGWTIDYIEKYYV